MKTLCFLSVIENGLDVSDLPRDLQREYDNLTKPNKISTKLRTLPLG